MSDEQEDLKRTEELSMGYFLTKMVPEHIANLSMLITAYKQLNQNGTLNIPELTKISLVYANRLTSDIKGNRSEDIPFNLEDTKLIIERLVKDLTLELEKNTTKCLANL